MTFQDIVYFSAVAEAGSISAAAETLFRSYQNVHASVQRLERELGQKLFLRDSGAFELTPFGEYFRDVYSTPILAKWAELPDCVERYQRYRDGRLYIGLLGVDCEPYAEASRLALDFAERKSAEGFDVKCVRRATDTLERELETERLDAALCVCCPENRHLERSRPFLRELRLCVSGSDPLARRDAAATNDVMGRSLVVIGDSQIYRNMLIKKLSLNEAQFVNFSRDNLSAAAAYLRTGQAVRIAATDNIVTLPALYEGCVSLPFDPPQNMRLAFMYKKRPTQKKLLNEFLAVVG